ncbi:hypothetical protein D3C71_1566900 [compost metagenome]
MDFCLGIGIAADGRLRPIEHGNRALAAFDVSVHIGYLGAEQTIGLRANLVRCAVIDIERARSTTYINTQMFPRERRLEDALAEVAGEEECIGAVAGNRCEEAQLLHADILRLVHRDVIEYRMLALEHDFGKLGEHFSGSDLASLF